MSRTTAKDCLDDYRNAAPQRDPDAVEGAHRQADEHRVEAEGFRQEWGL